MISCAGTSKAIGQSNGRSQVNTAFVNMKPVSLPNKMCVLPVGFQNAMGLPVITDLASFTKVLVCFIKVGVHSPTLFTMNMHYNCGFKLGILGLIDN